MTDDIRNLELVRDDELTQTLRAIYAPPSDTAYWSFLERRILDRLASEDGDAWWAVPAAWLRVGLVAAGIAVIVAGTLLLRTQTQMARAEYETVVDPTTIDAPTLAARERLTEQQTNVRILTGH
ncbi:MAG: hypothetical protein HYR75_09915 [Gemmatimonadetes bacterium]|nr:hypothetical protein [Gemmatimonadota bacterium]MBI3569165.1 hypothetical protein [Gemmatimonadota bacterium]